MCLCVSADTASQCDSVQTDRQADRQATRRVTCSRWRCNVDMIGTPYRNIQNIYIQPWSHGYSIAHVDNMGGAVYRTWQSESARARARVCPLARISEGEGEGEGVWG
jgi:hypothetical protein